MQSYLDLRKQALFYSEIYAWATLALSHPQCESSIGDALKILEDINNTADQDAGLTPEVRGFKHDETINKMELLFLQQEHSRLFIGPFSLLAPPYESFHRGKSALMGEISSAVEQFYLLAGMEISPEFKDAPDHIILEVEFLSRLCEMEELAWAKEEPQHAAASREIQEAFLQKHLLVWIDSLQNAVETSAQCQYYPLVLKILSKTAHNHYLKLKNTRPATT